MKALPPSFGPISSVFGSDTSDDRMNTGITTSYPILRIKGKVWSISRGSEDPTILMRPNNDGPRNSLDVVILAASQYVSKMYYERGFEEGASEPPDCFSTNGIVPDVSSKKKQCTTCAACDNNKWGSKITPAGKKAKACGDSKRVAVSPLGDIANEAFGGPMLLRIPAASLAALAAHDSDMHARGYRYYSIGTKISFEPTEAYPKLVFEPIRPLSDEEAETVLDLRKSEVIKNILQEGTDHAQEAHVEPPALKAPSAGNGAAHVTQKVTPPQPTPAPVEPKATPLPSAPGFTDGLSSSEATPPPATPRVARKPRAAAPPPPPPPPPAEQEGEEAAGGDFESTLDAQLESLMPSAE